MSYLTFLILIFNLKCSFSKFLIKLNAKRKDFVPFTNETFIEYFYSSSMTTNLCLGTPKQCLDFKINFDACAFYAMSPQSKINGSTFDSQKSSTYKKESESPIIEYYDDQIYESLFSSETVHINDKSYDSFKFGYGLSTSFSISYYHSAGIGLKISSLNNQHYRYGYTFIPQLKQKNIIEDYTFTYIIKNYDEAQLIIGDYPHNYDPNNYDLNKIHNTSVHIGSFSDSDREPNNVQWQIKFTSIKLADIDIGMNIRESLISPTTELLGCNVEYKNYIFGYFSDYIHNKTCQLYQQQSSSKSILKCNNTNINSDIVKNFPVLNFYSKEMNFTFTLNGNDLFIERDNDIYLLINFQENPIYWILGKPFMKKYTFTFNSDKKQVYYYEPSHKESGKKFQFSWTILVIILLIILIIILIFIIYKIRNKRKMRATELEDEGFDYHPMNQS